MKYRNEDYSLGGYVSTLALGAVFNVPILLVKAAVTAFSVFMLWNWYLAAHFGHLTFAAAVGFALIGSFITYYPRQLAAEPTHDQLIETLMDPFLVPLLALLTGWAGTAFLL